VIGSNEEGPFLVQKVSLLHDPFIKKEKACQTYGYFNNGVKQVIFL
jgi:hypothetical protein